MQKKLRLFISILLFALAIPADAAVFQLDPNHTYVSWQVSHFDFSTQTGKWYAQGTLVLDKDKPQYDKVNATIKLADIITGLPDLDKHLKGKLFFDVDQFPTATFVSDKVTLTGKTTAQVHGVLTLHGISKPVVLNVKLNKSGVSMISNKMTVGFSATAQIKRSDFGITTLLPGVSDEVNLHIEAEAYLLSQ